MGETKIEWTDAVWNPSTGCSKVSSGCRSCYAERIFPRAYSRDMMVDEEGVRPRKFTDVVLHEDRLDLPLHWKRPRMVFVNSMSDLFHPDVPDEFIHDVLGVIEASPQHVFQILTKRPERMLRYMTERCRVISPPSNGWLGVSIEDQATANERIPFLLQTPAAVRWLSAEPLLGPVDFARMRLRIGPDGKWTRPLTGEWEYRGLGVPTDGWKRDDFSGVGPKIDWIVAGSESGPKARPMHPDWARSIRDQCKAAKVPFFMKQMHMYFPSGMKLIKEMELFPDDLQVREYPEVHHA